MKPPGKYIKVFGGWVEMIAVPDFQKNEDTWGEFLPYLGVIRYDPSRSVAKSIIHEGIHAFRTFLGLYKIDGTEEETATEITETAICAFVMDNLELSQWILDEFKRIRAEVDAENLEV